MATKKSASKSTNSAKDVKSTKTAKPTSKSSAASSKTTKTTTKSTSAGTKNTSTKPKKETGRVIACIIGAIAVIALIIIGIFALVANMDGGKNSLTVKDGDGNKVTTAYVSFDDFRLKIPTDFKALSAKEVEQKYGKQNAPKSAYTNEAKDAYIAIAPTDSKLANDQVETYYDTMKASFELVAEVIDGKYYTSGSHNIADIEFVTGDDYSNTIFFSEDNKLVTIIFECKDSVRKKWQPVGKFIMDSIDFTK